MPKKVSKKRKSSKKDTKVLHTKTRKKSYRTRGGNVIGIGSSGCVIHPNITCDKYQSSKQNVSKIINKDSLQNEFKIINIFGLDKLPRITKYLILPLSYCNNLLNEYYNFQNDINACIDYMPSLSILNNNINIIQEYGGITLNEHRKSHLNQSFDDMKLYYIQLFEAIKYLNKNDLIHRDIKNDNIVINTTNKTMKLIDIGLMEFIDENKNLNNKDIFTFAESDLINGYIVYPIEYYIFGDIINGNLLPITQTVFDNYSKFYTNLSFGWLSNDDIRNYWSKIGMNSINTINRLVNSINSIMDDDERKEEIIRIKTEFNKTLDVFSLGAVLNGELNKIHENNEVFKKMMKDFIFDKLVNQYYKRRLNINDAYDEFMRICNLFNK